MRNVVYIDVLIVINIFVNYFLLLTTSRALHESVTRKRLILSSLFGSVFSLIILLPPINNFIMALIKLIISFILIYFTFGYGGYRVLLKRVLVFFVINFIFAGSMLAIWMFIGPIGMFYNNGVAYFNISVEILVISTIAAYFIVKLFHYISERRVSKDQLYEIMIELNGKELKLKGFVDTGNTLCDVFTGVPVSITSLDYIIDIIPNDLLDIFIEKNIDHTFAERLSNHEWSKKIKLIPYNVISESSLMLAFKPDKIVLTQRNNSKLVKSKKINTLIGISKSNKVFGDQYNLLLNNNIKI